MEDGIAREIPKGAGKPPLDSGSLPECSHDTGHVSIGQHGDRLAAC